MADSQWISRAIVSLGRYPDKRPHGLKVDSTGSMGLADLMRVWGTKQGLSDEDVLGAVRKHMFHEGEGGALRFAMGEHEDGSIWIRVLPKRGRGCATPARAQWPQKEKQANRRSNPWISQAGSSRGAAQKACSSAFEKGIDGNKPLEDRLSMGLDEMIKSRHDSVQLAGTSPVPIKDKLTMPLDEVIKSEDVEMKTSASPNKASDRGKDWGSQWNADDKKGGNWDSWDWGSSSWSKSNRQRSRPGGRDSWHQGGWQERGNEDERQLGESDISRSPTRSRSQSWRRAKLTRRQDGVPPPRPPGPHWTKYQDGNILWWHYQGPLGQWFWSSEMEEPKPLEADQ